MTSYEKRVVSEPKTSAISATGSVNERQMLGGKLDRIIEQSKPSDAQVVPDFRIDLALAVSNALAPSLNGTTLFWAMARLDRAGLVLVQQPYWPELNG